MITGNLQHGPELVACAVWSLACFGVGVSWSAYRAVGWVDRMRSWAHTAEVEE